MLNRTKRLIIKEFLAILRDKRSRALLIIPPVLQLLVFSFAATHEVKNVNLGVYTEDRGYAASRLISHLRAAKITFSHVKLYHNLKSVKRAIDSQKVIAVVYIEPQFTKNMEIGVPAVVQIILDGRKANASLIVQGYINRIIQEFVSEWHEEHRGRPDAVLSTAAPRVWFNPNLKATWSTVPALVGILSNLVVLLITALSIARERELGTFEQLLVSPLRPVEILIGKSVPALVLGVTEGMLMSVAVMLVFRLPITAVGFVLLFFSMLLFVLSIVGVGLFISSLSKTQQQGFLGAFAYQVPATLLCGFATPIENMPHWLQLVAYINPLQYMVALSRSIFLESPSPALVSQMAWPLIPIGAFTLVASMWLFRRKME